MPQGPRRRTRGGFGLGRAPSTTVPISSPPPRDALEGKGPQRLPQRRLDRRLKEVATAVGGSYCRLEVPLKLALAVRGTVARHRLGTLEGDGGVPPLPMHPCPHPRPPRKGHTADHRVRHGDPPPPLGPCVTVPASDVVARTLRTLQSRESLCAEAAGVGGRYRSRSSTPAMPGGINKAT